MTIPPVSASRPTNRVAYTGQVPESHPQTDTIHLASRIAISLLRRRIPLFKNAVVDIGGARVIADLTTPFGLYLYRRGFPQPEAHLLRTLLRPGDVFVDGGAHIGIFTLIAASVVGKHGCVLACEPIEGTMRLLSANVHLNGFDQVKLKAVALAEEAGRTQIYSFGAGSAFSSFAPATLDGSERTEIDVVSLDELTDGCRDRVRLVKLDLEGAEVSAVRGAVQLLKHRPDFLVEVEPDHLRRQGTTVEELEELFRTCGYTGYRFGSDQADAPLRPVDSSWGRPPGNPNMFLSVRPREQVLAPAEDDE